MHPQIARSKTRSSADPRKKEGRKEEGRKEGKEFLGQTLHASLSELQLTPDPNRLGSGIDRPNAAPPKIKRSGAKKSKPICPAMTGNYNASSRCPRVFRTSHPRTGRYHDFERIFLFDGFSCRALGAGFT